MNSSKADKEEGELENENNQNKESLNDNSATFTEYTKRAPISQWASRSSDLYEKVLQVGEGTFGKVYKAKIKSIPVGKNISNIKGDHVALKRILMDNEKEGFPITAIREIMILKRLNHENIINLIEIVTSKPSERNKFRGNVYLVFEYMEHDLSGLVELKIGFKVEQIKCILHQILTGVNYLHSNNIIHRDIKGANILINNRGEVKIADFGLARIHNPNPNVNKQYTNRVVTLWYRSPELLLGSTNYGPAIDMWSVGCLFSELLSGVPPFRGTKENDQIEKIFEKCGSPSEETWPGVTSMRYYHSIAPKQNYTNVLKSYYDDNKKVSAVAFDLLSKMLQLDPNKRITAKEALEHPYFKEEPIKCSPKDLPKIDKDAHEFQSRQNRRQQGNNQVQPNAREKGEMIVSKQSYQNNNYYSKNNNNETRIKIEESRVVYNQAQQFQGINSYSTSRLESLISNNNPTENTMLNNKRFMESTMEEETVSVKKPRNNFSPEHN